MARRDPPKNLPRSLRPQIRGPPPDPDEQPPFYPRILGAAGQRYRCGAPPRYWRGRGGGAPNAGVRGPAPALEASGGGLGLPRRLLEPPQHLESPRGAQGGEAQEEDEWGEEEEEEDSLEALGSKIIEGLRRSCRLAAIRRALSLPVLSPVLESSEGRGHDQPGPSQEERHSPERAESEGTPEVLLNLRLQGSPGFTPLKVLFTRPEVPQALEVALASLGGSVATSVYDCSHLVTQTMRRTIDFLCALGRGVPIVTPQWLLESVRVGRVLPVRPFLCRDPVKESRFEFNLEHSLWRARCHPLFQGYEIHVTPSVRPSPELMKHIITCCGGTFLPTMPDTYRPRCVVVSCPEDSECWGPALNAQLPLCTREMILTGVLRQHLQLYNFLLTTMEPQNPPRDPRKHPKPP